MKSLLITILLLALAAPCCATWTNQINADTTCTSGASCTTSVSPTSGWLVFVAAVNGIGGSTVSSCCGGAGCTWVADVTTSTAAGVITIQHSTNCGGTSLALGPTWGVNNCASGPSCHTSVYAFSTSTALNAVDGKTNCTTFTWCSPAGLSSSNDVFVAVVVTTGDATGCSGGSSPTCHLDANGNGSGFEVNVTGTSYSAPSWTGTSGTNNVGTVAFSETAGSGGATPAAPKQTKLDRLGENL